MAKSIYKTFYPTANNPCTHPKKLRLLAEHPDLWKTLIANPSFPSEGLQDIVQSILGKNESFTRTIIFPLIVRNPNASAEVLDLVFANASKLSRNDPMFFGDIVSHPNASWPVLEQVIAVAEERWVFLWDYIEMRPEGELATAKKIVDKLGDSAVAIEDILTLPDEIKLGYFKELMGFTEKWMVPLAL